MQQITVLLPAQKQRHAHRYTLALLAAVAIAALSSPVTSASTNEADSASATADGTVARARTLLASGNQFWSQQLTKGGSYYPAEVTFFDHDARNVCGETGPLSGPFYCPADNTVYLDRAFLHQVVQRLSGDSADYALAYLVGHELGLHIQDLVGTTDLVQQARSNSSAALSARTWMTAELQADCYAGLWLRWATAHHEVKPAPDADAVLSSVSAV